MTAAIAYVILSQVRTADQVLKKMSDAYTSCTSCEVKGEVKTVFHANESGSETVVKPFHLWFERPGRWRFEFTEKGERGDTEKFVAWTDKNGAHTWWTLDNTKTDEESADLAFAFGTGISSGAALTVPNLLDPQSIQGWSVLDIREPKLAEPEMVGPIHCHKIEGYDFLGDPLTLWIDKDRYRLSKMVVKSQPGGTSVSDRIKTTTYETTFNKDIPRPIFDFVPPAD